MGKKNKKKKARINDLTEEMQDACSLTEKEEYLKPDQSISKIKLKYRRKRTAKIKKDDFEAYLNYRKQNVTGELPSVIACACSDPALLQNLGLFVNSYIDAFESADSSRLYAFYHPSASFTLQFAPYLCRAINRGRDCTKLRVRRVPLWVNTFESASVNLLPGGIPLPAWTWSHMNVESAKRLHNHSLTKVDKKLVKALTALQTEHSKSANRGGPLHGAADIVSLLLCSRRLPRLKHVRDDRCCQLDVVGAESAVLFFRYACLALHPLPVEASAEELREIAKQLVVDERTGQQFLVYLVNRSLMLAQDAASGSPKIVQEDLAIVPAPEAVIEKHHDILKKIISQPAPPPTATSCPPADLVVKVKALASRTGLSLAYAGQCLLECAYDLDIALQAAERAKQAGCLPADAFDQPPPPL